MKSEAMLSLEPEQQQQKNAENQKLFFPPPHYFNSFDLESKLVINVGESDVTYCDLLFPDGAIKGPNGVHLRGIFL